MRILVTGVSGFIGRQLARLICADPNALVMGTDIRQPMDPSLGMHSFHRCDLIDRDAVFRLLAECRPDKIFNMAGMFDGDTDRLFAVNVDACINILDAAYVHCPEARILVVGTAAEYGRIDPRRLPVSESEDCHPTEPYGIGKLAATQIALHYHRVRKLNVVIARPFNVIGPGSPASLLVGAIIMRIKEAIHRGSDKLRVGNLSSKRDFLDVRDVAAACVALLDIDSAGQIFNICSGTAIPVHEIVDTLLLLSGARLTISVDEDLLRHGEVDSFFGSPKKLESTVDFHPAFSLDESLNAAWKAASTHSA